MGKIIIKIRPDGTLSVEAEGYTGTSCTEATAFLMQLGVVQEDHKKPEYYAETQKLVEYG